MNKKLKDILSNSLFFLCVILLSFLIIKFVGQRTVVIGPSMMPTLEDGNNLIIDKISYRFHEPERFDIVIFPFRNNSGNTYIKRVIGLPGETVRIDEDGVIYINDEVLHESYGREIIQNPGNALNGFTLKDGEYYVLGDNRNDSEDSRFSVGVVHRREIVGRAVFRIWPFAEMGPVK
ncbi:MAG: signal peptidase I [Lachnospiraceae bacterium]|nr:signal peptidase I [Lachnospiraceae bacterium]